MIEYYIGTSEINHSRRLVVEDKDIDEDVDNDEILNILNKE